MPVTLSGNTHSQSEHRQSTEPTELRGTELGLNREARSPWTCMRKRGQCLSSTHTSMVRRVGPSPDMNTATIVTVSIIFFFFLTSNESAVECWCSHQISLYLNQTCKVMAFSPLICISDYWCYHKCLLKERKNKTCVIQSSWKALLAAHLITILRCCVEYSHKQRNVYIECYSQNTYAWGLTAFLIKQCLFYKHFKCSIVCIQVY